MSEVVMPRLSDSMEEGTIISWLKQVGDEVAVGDALVEIETDKANMAYEADEAGVLTEILAEEGETLPIGSPIARIGDSAEGQSSSAAGPVTGGEAPSSANRTAGGTSPPVPPAEEAAESDADSPSAEEEAEQQVQTAPARSSDGDVAGERIKASPLARRLAKDKGLDLSQLQGSGPGGRIVKHDVEEAESSEGAAPPAGDTGEEDPRAVQFVEHGSSSPVAGPAGQGAGPAGGTAKGEVETREPTKLQSTIARRMAESKATAPHFYLTIEIDMGKAVDARAAIKAASKEGDVVPSFNDMVVKACAIALREFPKANGAYRDGRFELYSRVNVGVAVAAEESLVVPTIFDADRKGLRQIASDTRAVAAKVRDGSVTPPELSGGTFTVSNLGMYGIEVFDAVINMGQAAILAVGAIREAPAVRDGQVVPARLMKATLSCDHRILYGAEGAEFLARVKQLLEEPVSLAL
ncbi:MAG TPA: dihydrolipoamide acetyltransferase family protein [Solirubrobacterales bacterium]|nr:dihydrolipoamide acetyltransferase family protein [Solirubrobacterales bacterium]